MAKGKTEKLEFGLHSSGWFEILDGDEKPVETYRYRNPDGSRGGIVACTARIDKSVTVPESSVVGHGIVLEAGDTIGEYEIIL